MYWIFEVISVNKSNYSFFTCEYNNLGAEFFMQLDDLSFDFHFFTCEEFQNLFDY